MNQPDFHYFVLIIPACLLLLGIAFIVCRRILHEQVFLSWVGIGYILPAIGLAAQSLMTNQQLADWSVVTGVLYLFGVWAIAHGVALRTGGTGNPRIALPTGLVILILLFYYSQIQEDLWLRIIFLNLGVGLMQLMVAKHFFTLSNKGDRLDRILTLSYSFFIIYTLLRPLVIIFTVSPDELGDLSTSNYWLLMLATNILLSLWLALIIFAITVRDIVQRMNEERYHDSLTQLLNRRGFFEAAKTFMDEDQDSQYFLLTCDIDHFKNINDNWGHMAGDKVLQDVSKTILQNVREEDLVSRFGGEEFVLFLKCIDMDDAYKVAERIRESIKNTLFTDISVTVTASFGLVRVTSHHNLMRAIGRADRLLYQAKQEGRNRVCLR